MIISFSIKKSSIKKIYNKIYSCGTHRINRTRVLFGYKKAERPVQVYRPFNIIDFSLDLVFQKQDLPHRYRNSRFQLILSTSKTKI